MRIAIIAAVAENGVIGRRGALPWHLSTDLRRFKRLTMGQVIVMGRKTWESIGRPLPGRTMIVISRQSDFRTGFDEVQSVTSMDGAIQIAQEAGDQDLFIIGGAEIYRQGLPHASRLYLTRVRAKVEGDTHFPEIELGQWKLIESESHEADANVEFKYCFEVYDRVAVLAKDLNHESHNSHE